MPSAPNRLPADASHGWGGRAIDRSKPLSFRLDGQAISGFAGDSLLSALLAAGLDSAGLLDGVSLALDAASPLFVARRDRPDDPLPLERTPALDGLDLVTLGAPLRSGWFSRLAQRFAGPRRHLLARLPPPAPLPWLAREPDERLVVDTLVVGGGMAGLAAARAARGKVLLAERQLSLGGDARFYGTVGEEMPVEERLESLASGLAAEIWLGAEVFRLRGTIARVHRIVLDNGRPVSRVAEITAGRVVLATGAAERLPVFAGNRLPGVTGAIAAFHLAERFGVWPGKTALISTPAAEGYRLGLRAQAAGIDVLRVADTRLAPNSRFIDFCKASGASLATGLVPQLARLSPRGGLSVTFSVAIEHITQETASLETDRLIAAGGRQPELTLWLAAGGAVAWQGDRFLATGDLPGVALAGAAAGWRRSDPCVASGTAAGRGKPADIVEQLIDPAFESPAAPTAIGPSTSGPPAFLAATRLPTLRPADPAEFSPRSTLGLTELASLVQLGALTAQDAGAIASERVTMGSDLVDPGWTVPARPAAAGIPDYLQHRFGGKTGLYRVGTADARFLETGALIFADGRERDPARAVGVVLRRPPGNEVGGIALLARDAAAAGLHVRDSGGAVPLDRVAPER